MSREIRDEREGIRGKREEEWTAVEGGAERNAHPISYVNDDELYTAVGETNGRAGCLHPYLGGPPNERFAMGVFLYGKRAILFLKILVLLHKMVEYQNVCRRDEGIPPYDIFVFTETS